MVELMQNLIEISAILERMGQSIEVSMEVTSIVKECYDPIDGITYI